MSGGGDTHRPAGLESERPCLHCVIMRALLEQAEREVEAGRPRIKVIDALEAVADAAAALIADQPDVDGRTKNFMDRFYDRLDVRQKAAGAAAWIEGRIASGKVH